MTVAELIAFLEKQPQDILVAITMYSENVLLDASDIEVVNLCDARPDGWVANARPDKPTRPYLLFPGN